MLGMKHHLVDLYQACSNYAPVAKNGPTPGDMFYIGSHKGKHDKFFLSDTTMTSLYIKYVASPSRPISSLFKLCPWGQNWSCHGDYMFIIGLYWENMIKSSCKKPQGLNIAIWYLASPSGPLSS